MTRQVLKALAEHAERAHPLEACGLLLGAEGRITDARPAENLASDPARHFEIDPRALIDAHRAARGGGAQVIGYYHSHPAGPPEPSATDRAQASGDGRVWAIVGAGQVRFWGDETNGFVPLSYAVIEG